MRTLLAIVLRDLVRWRRNPGRLAFLLALPLVLAAVFALAFGSGGGQLSVHVLLEDEDGTALSRFLVRALAGSKEMGPLDVELVGSEGRERIERGEASGLVIVPEGFTEAVLDGRPAQLVLVKNPAERFLPQAVEEALRAGAALLSVASRMFHDELVEFDRMIEGDARPPASAIGALSERIAEKMDRVAPYLLPPVVDLAVEGRDQQQDAPGMRAVVSLMLPGLSVLSLLFFAQAATRDVLEERERGRLRRLLAAPVGAGDYLLAKSVSAVLVSALGFGVLVLLGVLAGVDWGPPAAVVALLFASALAASGLLLMLVSLARTENSSNALTTTVVMLSSLIGGSFVPVTVLPAFLLPLSRLTVNYWSARGFLTLIQGAGGLGDIGIELAVLTAGGVVLLVAGALRLRRSIRRGEV